MPDQPVDGRVGVRDLLEVVEDEQHLPVRDELQGPVPREVLHVAGSAQRVGDRRPHQLGAVHRVQRDEEQAVRVGVLQGGGDRERDPGLARPAGTGERHQPDLVVAEQAGDLGELRRPADQRRRGDRQVGAAAEAAQRREVVGQVRHHEVVQVLRLVEVLEPVPAEVADRRLRAEVADQGAGGLRDHRLAAAGGGGDPGRAVHVDADVAVLVRLRLAGVQPDPHADVDVVGPGVAVQQALALEGGGDRRAGGGEDDEEAVPLGAHLPAVVLAEHRAQQRALGAQRLTPAGTEAGQHPGRALDVAEQEGHRPGLRGAHGPSVLSWTAPVAAVLPWSRAAGYRPEGTTTALPEPFQQENPAGRW